MHHTTLFSQSHCSVKRCSIPKKKEHFSKPNFFFFHILVLLCLSYPNFVSPNFFVCTIILLSKNVQQSYQSQNLFKTTYKTMQINMWDFVHKFFVHKGSGMHLIKYSYCVYANIHVIF